MLLRGGSPPRPGERDPGFRRDDEVAFLAKSGPETHQRQAPQGPPAADLKNSVIPANAGIQKQDRPRIEDGRFYPAFLTGCAA